MLAINLEKMSIFLAFLFFLLTFKMCSCSRADVMEKRDYLDKIDDIMGYKYVLSEMKAANIKDNLRYLTEYPHHPGSERNTELAKEITRRWEKSGFDKTEVFPYNIYLSYPTSPGELSLLNKGVLTEKLVITNEPSLDPTETKGKPIYPFNAYSPAGDVTAEYIYGNYGLEKDFDVLEQLGVNVSGAIMLIRYGKTARGNKVRAAESRGAIGVILFTDPADYATPGDEYPNGWGINKYSVQRGTINRLTGDALSLGYPSKPGYFRLNETKYSGNPKIPSQPISYSSAQTILQFMIDDSVPLPVDFQGGLNFTYVLQSGKDRKIRLKVSTKLETRESLTVCTTLFGKEEPDRYIMFGSHRDSWVYGASDACSGMATSMEIVRAFGHIKKRIGWRPRRSIMACSWGAEEVGTLGSSEWADENHKFLTEKVVAYLNADVIVDGNFTVDLKALEMLRRGIHKAAKYVDGPDNSSVSLYEDWGKKSVLLKKSKDASKPNLRTPSSYSDYKSLWHTYGTTVADFRYTFKRNQYPGITFYSIYHTLYDSFGWMKKFIDPTFVGHLTIGRLMAGYSLVLSNSIILPYDLHDCMKDIRHHFNHFKKSYKSLLKEHEISLSFVHQRLHALTKKAKAFDEYKNNIKLSSASLYEIRSINDKLMNFERNFLVTGISKTLSARHVIYSVIPTQLKKTKFPGISEAIYHASKDPNNDWDEVRKQITLLVWCIDTANRSLDIEQWGSSSSRI